MTRTARLSPAQVADLLERTPRSSFIGGRFLGGTPDLEVQNPATGAALTHVVDADDLPTVDDFQERYCGEWTHFREFADNHVDETGILDGASETARRYFDYDSFADDLAHDYITATCDDGGIFVFRAL